MHRIVEIEHRPADVLDLEPVAAFLSHPVALGRHVALAGEARGERELDPRPVVGMHAFEPALERRLVAGRKPHPAREIAPPYQLSGARIELVELHVACLGRQFVADPPVGRLPQRTFLARPQGGDEEAEQRGRADVGLGIEEALAPLRGERRERTVALRGVQDGENAEDQDRERASAVSRFISA